jgi:hypothetical protein
VLLAACGSNPAGADANLEITCNNPSAVSFQTDVAPLINHCGGELCHGGLGPSWRYSVLVNVATTECSDQRVIVKPGDPAASYLIQKLAGINMCNGERMPKLGTAFPDADMRKIEDWICEGAANN